MQIDQTKVLDAILASSENPIAREVGAGLAEAYIAEFAENDAARFKVLNVETAWGHWLDDWTLIVGQCDARLQDETGVLLLELKSHKEPRRTKAGEYYKGDGPQDWLDKISSGPQLAIYALHEIETTGADHCRIMVRAAVKSQPVTLWPPNESDGIFILSREYVGFMRNALLVRAAEIRAARQLNVLPWDFTDGHKCQRMYGLQCQYYEPFCKEHRHPEGRKRIFSETDPGAAAIEAALKEREIALTNERLVILSASAYQDYSACRERGRITQDGLGGGEESEALSTGSCFHAGVACAYQQIQEQQKIVS